ncbi:hypothetical protein D3C81_1945970 [compost metagenome]
MQTQAGRRGADEFGQRDTVLHLMKVVLASAVWTGSRLLQLTSLVIVRARLHGTGIQLVDTEDAHS